MGWLVVAVLIAFYLLGLYVIHAGRGVQTLPIVAMLVLIIDFVATRRFGRTK
jgi:hypothetical protein